MKKSLLILTLMVLGTVWSSAQDKIPVVVTKISDGDTFWASDGSGQSIKFRPIGFNCPEESNFGKPAEPFNEEATAYTTSMIMGDTVMVEYDVQQSDKWGRHLVYVYLQDGRLLNEEILKAGWAEVATYPPNIKYVELFIKAQSEGRSNKQGMWAK